MSVRYRAGAEREGLRVDKYGRISVKPHPLMLGNKDEDPYIGTDFAEAQIEIATKVCSDTEECYADLKTKTLQVLRCLELQDEYLWPYSMPAVITDYDITVCSQHPSKPEKQRYIERLYHKYDLEMMLVSGVHFNFSLPEEQYAALRTEHEGLPAGPDDAYCLIARNLQRYAPLMNKAFGSSPFAIEQPRPGRYAGKEDRCSLRNSQYGYVNEEDLCPGLGSKQEYFADLRQLIEEGKLLDTSELYQSVRLKTADDQAALYDHDLPVDHLEVRWHDIDPLDICGISRTDMDLLVLLIFTALFDSESEKTDHADISGITELAAEVNDILDLGFDEAWTLLKRIESENWTKADMIREKFSDKEDLLRIAVRYNRQACGYAEEYLKIINDLRGDEAGRRGMWQRMCLSNARWANITEPVSYMPVLLSENSRCLLTDAAHILNGILRKIIRHYQKSPAYREEFHFDPRLEQLLQIPCIHGDEIPLLRADCLFDEDRGRLQFCEFNTDAIGGMIENIESQKALAETEPYKKFAQMHDIISEAEWQIGQRMAAIANIYEAAGQSCKNARLAVAVCLDGDEPDATEFRTFISFLEKHGFICSVFDVRQFVYRDGKLFGCHALLGESNINVDVVWRFCIVRDLLQHWEEIHPFIQAVRDEAVVMISGFLPQIVHDKQIFAVMRGEQTKELLNEQERDFVEKHIPLTSFIDDPALDLPMIKAEPERWIIKPTNWYCSKNVLSGTVCSLQEWSEAIDDRLNGEPHSWLIQRFCEPSRLPSIPLRGKEQEFTAPPQLYNTVYGLYICRGEYDGLYVRQSYKPVVSSMNGGVMAPLLWVHEHKSDDGNEEN